MSPLGLDIRIWTPDSREVKTFGTRDLRAFSATATPIFAKSCDVHRSTGMILQRIGVHFFEVKALKCGSEVGASALMNYLAIVGLNNIFLAFLPPCIAFDPSESNVNPPDADA